ncbi:MAG: HEAT repeat domain-containing protein [Candidatus Hodarchaeales archaeon]
MPKVNIKKVSKDMLDRRSTFDYRKQCARQLVSTGDLKVLDYFYKVLKNTSEDPHFRAYCCTVLDPDNIKNQDLLFGLFVNKHEHEEVRIHSIKQLVKGKKPDTHRKTSQLLRENLLNKGEDPHVRFWAAWGLGELKAMDAIQPLLDILYDKTNDLQVRRSCATALTNIDRSPATQQIVLGILSDYSENPWARRNSVRILKRLGNKSTIPALKRVLDGETSDKLKGMLRSLIEELQERD